MAATTIAEQFAQVHIGAAPAPVYKMTVTTTAPSKCAPPTPPPPPPQQETPPHQEASPDMRTILGGTTYDRLLRSEDPFSGTDIKLGTPRKAIESGRLSTSRTWLNERRTPKDVLWLAQVKLTTLKRNLRAERERAMRREGSGEEKEEEEGDDDRD